MRVRPRRLLLRLAGALLLVAAIYVVALLVGAYRTVPAVLERARQLEETGLTITDLPEEWKEILLKVEDPGFYSHNGVDLTTSGAGLTTITQGLVKRHFFASFRPGVHAKLRQTIGAFVLDRKMDKDLQLTLLLNTAGFGSVAKEPVVGFPGAARAYFGKRFADLSRDEYVSLVAMLVGPNAFNPRTEPDAHGERVTRIGRLLAGECEPTGVRDVYYEGCAR